MARCCSRPSSRPRRRSRDPFPPHQDRGRGEVARRGSARGGRDRRRVPRRAASAATHRAGLARPGRPADACRGTIADRRRGRRGLRARSPHRRARARRRRARARRRASSAGPPRGAGIPAGLVSGELRQGALDALLLDGDRRGRRGPGRRRCAARRCSARSPGRSPWRPSPAARRRSRPSGSRSGRPVRPMLASTAPDVDGRARRRLARPPCRRRQARRHPGPGRTARGDDVRVFTRSLDDITARLPEVVEAVAALPARDARARRRGDRARPGRPAAAVPGDRARAPAAADVAALRGRCR